MIFSPALASFLDALFAAEGQAGQSTAGPEAPGPSRHSVEAAYQALSRADDATLKQLGLTRQKVLQLMAQQFGR